MKKSLVMAWMVLSCGYILAADGTGKVPLPDLVHPLKVQIGKDRFVIGEKISVFIYSLSDFKLLKKFGKEGEGPGELKNRITRLEIQPEYIFINSVGKVSYFSKDGRFIKELKTPAPDLRLKPFGNHFIGERMVTENNSLCISVDIYDGDVKKVMHVYRREREVQRRGKGTRVFAHPLPYYVSQKKLFVAKGSDFVIDVLDESGKKLYAITHEYQRMRVTKDDRKRVMHHLETDPGIKPYLDMIKPIIFPDTFPPIRTYYVTDGRVYVLTYKIKEGETECLIFKANGQFLKKVFLPYRYKNPVDEYPADIKNDRLYQLVENEDSEEWELHITAVSERTGRPAPEFP
jgi:hypothetical protein